MELNLLSHHKFMKNATTIIAFSDAMPMATTTFHGDGISIHVTATVINVRKNSVAPIPHKNLADEM